MIKNLITAWFILMLILFARLNSYAESQTFYPTDDGYMSETGPDNGLSEELVVGYYTTYGNYRAVIKFDLSVIPPGSTINSAYLTCRYYMYGGSNANRNIRAYRVTANWNEGSITWNNNYYGYYDEQSVGGGYVKDYSWNVKSLVQYWVSGTYPNYGIMLKSYPEGGSSTNLLFFESKEHIGGSKPFLQVDYTPPHPTPQVTSICLNGQCSVTTTNIKIGESVTLKVYVTNNGSSSGQDASIQVSFPNFINSNDISYVTPLSMSSGLSYTEYSPGNDPTIWKYCSIPPYKETPDYVLAYASKDNWAPGESNYIELQITPQALGSFPIYIKSAMSNGSTYYKDPTDSCPSCYSDQQCEKVYDKYANVTVDPPTNPTPQDGAKCIATNPTLSWSAISGVNQYEIKFGTNQNCDSNPAYLSNTNSLPLSGLTLGQTYHWYVRAVVGSEQGPWSSCWSFTTTYPSLSAPLNPNPSDGAVDVPLNPTLSWSNVPWSTFYQIRYGTNSDCSQNHPTYTLYDNNNWYSPSTLIPDTDYYWSVRAGNACEYGPWSSCWHFKTAKQPKIRISPTTLVLSNIGQTSLNSYLRMENRDDKESFIDQLEQVESPYFYYYSNRRLPLEIDTNRIAIAGKDENFEISQQDDRISILEKKKLPIPDWHVLKIRLAESKPNSVEILASQISGGQNIKFVSPVFVGKDGGELIVTPKIIVGFRKEVDPSQAEQILDLSGVGKIIERNWANMEGVFLLESFSKNGFEVLRDANRLAELPEVKFAEPNMIFTGEALLTPNDPYFDECWGIHNTGQPNGTVDMDMDGPEAWDISTGDSSIIVVIIDNGVQQNHPDINQIGGTDTTSDGGDGGPVNSFDNHGTSVAGCVSAKINNSTGTVGIAPNCRIASARAHIATDNQNHFNTEQEWVVNALNWAENIGARVTNNSNRYGFYSSVINLRYEQTRNNGMIHFAAAGNDGSSTIDYPASIPSVNSVAALDRNGVLADFSGGCYNWVGRSSNFGSDLDFSAPGEDIKTTDRTGTSGYSNDDYTCVDGTSFASPYAAGVAALVLSVNNNLNTLQVEEILKYSSVDLGSPSYDTTYGWGFINAFEALRLATSSNSAYFTIYNDGSGPLEITSMTKRDNDPWLSFSPQAPLTIDPGRYQFITVSANWNLANVGTNDEQILVYSNDTGPNMSPYPNAVYVTAVKLDATLPTASLSVSNITTGGGTTHQFTVTYSDNTAVDVSDFDSNDIQVTGPNSYNQLASFISVNNNTDGTPRTVTYQISAPGGSWDVSDNGTYTVLMEANQVSDTNGNYVQSGVLDSFLVNIGQPEINIQGNGLTIVSGDTTPILSDGTDFGSVDVNSGTSTHTFTIQNTGTADLTLTGSPKVDISGTHSADFTVQTQPSSPIGGPIGSTTFDVLFDPSGEGLRTATISIANDDSDNNPYTFSIQGTGTIAIPTVNIEASDNAAESSTPGHFIVTRTGSTSSPLDVYFTLGSGTATPGSDFQIPSSPVTIPAGQSSTTITINPIDDTCVESNETVKIILSDNSSYTVISREADIAITDNDQLYFVCNTDSVTVPEGSSSSFQVRLNAKPCSNVTASVNWLSGDSDITVSSGSIITFTPTDGDQYQYVTLSSAEDSDTTSDSAIIRISAPGIPDRDITATELDNDAQVLEVGSGKPYTTIQSAINAASNGDTVLVYDGTYVENIDFLEKAITVKSINGPSRTIIDGNNSSPAGVVVYISGEETNPVLNGFTITNGHGLMGGGIFCSGTGGLDAQFSPLIVNCNIIGNTVSDDGGGITLTASTPSIINCIISNNSCNGWGAGIYIHGSLTPSIINCTISQNSAREGGGIYARHAGQIKVINTILWGNTASGSPSEISIAEEYGDTTIDIIYSDIEGGWMGTGNINTDPLFVGGGDYHIRAGSPCIDAGNSIGAPTYDIDGDSRPYGSGFDIGSDEYYGYTINLSVNAFCERQDTFNGGDTVYGRAVLGLSPNTSYPLYVVDDRSDWYDRMDIPTSCSQCLTTPETSFTTDGSGNMPCGTIIWQNLRTTSSSASFDIIIDVNSNGKFDFSTDFLDSMYVAGFTLIKLASFEAIPHSNSVTLLWTTESEIDNAGFNLYRAESEDGEYVKINDSLIPAEGTATQGATYQFIDESVKNRTTYYYKLEDIDLNGTSTMHGPVSAEVRRLAR